MLVLLSIMGVFGLGVLNATLGSFKLDIARALNISNARVGFLVTVMTFTSLVLSLVLGVAVDILGYRPLAATGFIIGAASLFALVYSRSYVWTVLSSFLLGVGATSLNTFGSTLITVVMFGGGNPSASLNLAHMFGALGAMTTPMVVSLFSARYGYRKSGVGLGLLLAAAIPLSLVATYPAASSDFEVVRSLALLTHPVIILSSVTLFCYIGIESIMGSWVSSYMADNGYTERVANFTVSLFWMSLMFGRLGASFLITPGIEMPVMFALVAGLIALFAGMTVNRIKAAALIEVFLSGLLLGPLFPLIAGRAFRYVDPSLRGSAFGIMLAIGITGACSMPAVVGVYSNGRPFRRCMIIPFGIAVVFLLLLMVLKAW